MSSHGLYKCVDKNERKFHHEPQAIDILEVNLIMFWIQTGAMIKCLCLLKQNFLSLLIQPPYTRKNVISFENASDSSN